MVVLPLCSSNFPQPQTRLRPTHVKPSVVLVPCSARPRGRVVCSPGRAGGPCHANIADYPSRGEFGLLEELGSTAMPLTFPPFDGWLSPEEARAAAADVPPAAQEPSQPGTSGAKSYDTGYSKRGRRSGGKPK